MREDAGRMSVPVDFTFGYAFDVWGLIVCVRHVIQHMDGTWTAPRLIGRCMGGSTAHWTVHGRLHGSSNLAMNAMNAWALARAVGFDW